MKRAAAIEREAPAAVASVRSLHQVTSQAGPSATYDCGSEGNRNKDLHQPNNEAQPERGDEMSVHLLSAPEQGKCQAC